MVYTQPKLTGIGKKKPELFEMGIGGKTLKDKLDYIKQFIGKEIKVTDCNKAGHAARHQGSLNRKGFHGTVKRYGVASGPEIRKDKEGHRLTRSMAPQPHPLHSASGRQDGLPRKDRAQQMVLMIGDKPADVNPKGGLIHYGVVKNPFILLKGDVVGPVKRIVRMMPAIRPSKKLPKEAPEISYISIESKQGN
jgi:large subunit ribosomal protein L3